MDPKRQTLALPVIGDVIATTTAIGIAVTRLKDVNDLASSGLLKPQKLIGGIDERVVAPSDFDPAKPAKDLRLWALAGRDRFFQEVSSENGKMQWVEVGVETLRLILREHFVRHRVAEGEQISQGDAVILYLHRHRRIDFVMKGCAGWRMGLHPTPDGSRVLILTEAQPTEPVEGEFPTIKELLDVKLGTEQLPYFLAWLKSALESYRDDKPGRFRPSQVLILIGDPSTGKNFIQMYVITALLGRLGDPTEWLTNAQASFNSDWFGKEHQAVCDPPGGGDKRTKRIFTSKLKSLSANESHRFHAKGKDAELMQPKFVVSISANKNYHSRAILPYVLASDIRDKLIVLSWSNERGPLPMRQSEREPFLERIQAELPAFAFYLLNEFQIPDEIIDRSGRFATNGYCEPGLADLFLSELPSHELLVLLRQARQDRRRIWDENADVDVNAADGEWVATANHIRKWLENSSVQDQASRFFKEHDNVGNLLAGIADVMPGLCRPDRNSHQRFWRFSIGELES